MDIIGAGLGRTGTLSTKAALEQLGYGPCHHMVELLVEGRTIEGFAAAARGEQVDWTEVLDGYGSCVDWPGCDYHAQLAEAFPDAKLVLNVRDGESWYESVQESIFKTWTAVKDGNGPIKGKKLEVLRDTVFGEKGTFEGRFEDKDFILKKVAARTEEIIATYSPDRLLVFDVKQGWEPLCTFLDKPVPDTEFPRLNDRAQFAKLKEKF